MNDHSVLLLSERLENATFLRFVREWQWKLRRPRSLVPRALVLRGAARKSGGQTVDAAPFRKSALPFPGLGRSADENLLKYKDDARTSVAMAHRCRPARRLQCPAFDSISLI